MEKIVTRNLVKQLIYFSVGSFIGMLFLYATIMTSGEKPAVTHKQDSFFLSFSLSQNYNSFRTTQAVKDTILLKEESTRLEQNRRIRHIRNTCADPSLFFRQMYNESILLYYFSPKYNFSYCKVPKVGSTFWTQAFTVLRNGSKIAQNVFRMPRKSVSTRLISPNIVEFDSEKRQKSRSILISRDPYTRLYSAFIDKMFLPAFSNEAVRIIKSQRNIIKDDFTCASDITFQEFLNEIVKNVHEGKALNRHWAPIVSLCNPCNVNAFALVKQESFATDVEYILNKLEIDSEEFGVIYNALHDHRVESTIPGMVETVLTTRSGSKRCKTKVEVARRIWMAFQIQGYLRDDNAFPKNTVNSDEKVEPAFMTDLILKTIRDNPLTSEESRIQRRRALVKAYQQVDNKTINDLKEIYKHDFMLFNYSLDQPR